MLSCLLDMHTLSLNLEISSERHVKRYQPSLLRGKKSDETFDIWIFDERISSFLIVFLLSSQYLVSYEIPPPCVKIYNTSLADLHESVDCFLRHL